MEPKSDSMAEESGKLSLDCEGEEVGVVGVLEVYIHQARDIHNICIYHNQDVYAKIFLTDDPEQAASTQIVNGGGKNPVFNEKIWVNVRTIGCLLRCEIWMMSRIRNYMEDQLLGFALVPLCDVVAGNGKASGEFALSSCDLFHSPAGFVQLTVGYTGALPPVLHMEVPTPAHLSGVADVGGGGGPGTPDSVTCELEKIEFPDPKIMNENEMMVSKYLELPCSLKDVGSGKRDLSRLNMKPEVQTDVCLPHSGLESQTSQQIGSASANVDQTCADNNLDGTTQVQTVQTPPLSVPSTDETARASKSPGKEDVSSPSRGNTAEAKGAEDSISAATPATTFSATPLISVSAVQEQRVVQQEIIDMYTMSMQQFTESLAKMKLPMDIEHESNTQNGKGDSKSRDTAENDMEPKCSKSSRVFYGSRAFF